MLERIHWVRAAVGAGCVLASGVTACDRPPLAVDAGPPVVQASAAATEGALLAQIRAGTAHYQRVEAATAAGYVRMSPCVYNVPGATGIHYQKPALVDAVIDPSQPEVLLYEPLPNGKLRLVGVEFLIPAAAWSNSALPMLGDQSFLDRRSPPFGAPFPNFALYVWVWQENPNGIYEKYNPKVSCQFADVAVIA